MRMPEFVDRVLDAAVVPSFGRTGYVLRGLEPVSEPMDGKRVVITGATGGIGRAAAEALAGLGADLVIVGRSEDKARRVAGDIEAGGSQASVEIADLSLMAAIRDLAERLRQGPPVDVLINNVGALFPERAETEEGIERTLALNLAGHFLLTNLMAPHLSEHARIVNVTSGGAYTQRIDLDYLQGRKGYKGSVMYAQTKRGQLILTELWASRLEPVAVHAMHPGWADTPGVEVSLPGFYRITRPLLRTPEQGADTIVWLAAADVAGTASGQFWLDRRPQPFHKLRSTRESDADRAALWEYLAGITGWDGS